MVCASLVWGVAFTSCFDHVHTAHVHHTVDFLVRSITKRILLLACRPFYNNKLTRMLPSCIDSSTFAETLRNQQQPVDVLGYTNVSCSWNTLSTQSDVLPERYSADALRNTSQLALGSSLGPNSSSLHYSVKMDANSTQEKNEKARSAKTSRRVSNNSWLTLVAPNPSFESGLFNHHAQFAASEVGDYRQYVDHPRPLLARSLSERMTNCSHMPTAETSAPLPNWIDFKPTPLPSGFLTNRKAGSYPDIESFRHKSALEKSMHTCSPDEITYAAIGSPRGATATDEPSIVSNTDSGRETPTMADVDQSGSLLHESCRLYPTTRAVVESALRLNPSSARQRQDLLTMSPQFSKKALSASSRVRACPYPSGCTLPLNIALENGASLDVVQLLVEHCPDAILLEDGPQACGSLSVALYHSASNEVVFTLILAKPDSVQMIDRRHSNSPLHVACAKGASFSVIQTLVQLYSKSLHHRNFHGQTPLDICQRHSSVCSDQVTDFLQDATFRRAAADLESVLNNNLDSEMEDF